VGPILIIEDDRKVAALVALYLQREGYDIVTAHDGRQGLELARSTAPSFVILDLMLPHLDGWSVCRELRRISSVPVLMLTARVDEIDRVNGLSIGADDYVVKPFSPSELVARVKAISRRVHTEGWPGTRLVHDDLVIEPDKRRVTVRGHIASLTRSEYTLLVALASAPGRVFPRQELLDRLYERGESVVERVVDVHIGKLRHKIEDDATNPRYVLTVRGVGYRFADGDGAPPPPSSPPVPPPASTS
jgi:DNA-binding response OmpR family regulator